MRSNTERIIPGLEKGQPIYRFFDKELYADQFAAGTLMVSTLETCRRYEDPLQGDTKEAVHSYNTGNACSADPRAQKAFEIFAGIERAQSSLNPPSYLLNCTRTFRIYDAYVICTTLHFQPDKLGDAIGNYCVKINSPDRFFNAVFNRLVTATFGNVIRAMAGRITYQPRNWTGNEIEPGAIGFVKPADPYESQQEVRFLAEVKNPTSLKPLILDVPGISRLCKRVR